MGTVTKTNSGKSAQGCGCGCGSASGCSQCAGGSASAMEQANSAALSRPRFFAGQLLTEDDMQATVDYSVAKFRLHNRYLFGAGVVCGLSVTCDPCNPRRVIVEPGYALDCCGNDLLVSCPESLDILEMVRRLRVEQGLDCGDPCAPEAKPKPPAKPKPTPTPNEPAERAHGRDGEQEQDIPERRYCLWVRYAERQVDPVAPYVTDAECGTRCEPTRIEESYRFELRCPSERPPAPDIVSSLMACIGDFLATQANLSRSAVLGVAGNRMQVASEAIATRPDAHYRIEDVSAFKSDVGALLARTDVALRKVEAGDAMTSDEAVAAVEDVSLLAGAHLRWALHDEIEKKKLGAFDVEKVAGTLRSATSLLNAEWRNEHIDLPLQRHEATARVELSAKWGLSETQGSVAGARELSSYEAQLLVQSVALSPALYGEYGRALQSVRDALLIALEGRSATRCRLLRDLRRIQIPTAASGNEVTASEVAALSVAIVDVVEVLLQYLLDCFCRALLPPCPPCDEDAVLLACLTLEDCEVTSICNLERSIVLTGPNVRYWLGPLRVVKGWLEKLCCELPKWVRGKKQSRIQTGPASVDGVKYAYAMRAAPIGPSHVFSSLSASGLESFELPDLAGAELQQFYRRSGRPIRFEEFKLAANDLSSVIAARAGATTLPVRAGVRRTSEKGAALLEALGDPAVTESFDRKVATSVERAVEAGRVDLSETVRRSSERALSTLRAERDTAVRGALKRWTEAEDGLAASATPLIRESIERHVAALRERMGEAVTRLAKDQGLDAEAMTRRIRTSIDAKLAETGLNAPSLTARIEGAITAALSANGLTQRTLNERLSDTVDTRVESLGLDAESLNARIRNQVDGQVASLGLAPTALGERIDAEVSRVLARDSLTPDALDSRLTAAVKSRTEEVASEFEKTTRTLDRRLAKETKALKDQIAALQAELKKLARGAEE